MAWSVYFRRQLNPFVHLIEHGLTLAFACVDDFAGGRLRSLCLGRSRPLFL